MQITIKHYGGSSHKPSKIIELTMETNNASITECITDLNEKVDEQLIERLESILEDLKEQNKRVEEIGQS